MNQQNPIVAAFSMRAFLQPTLMAIESIGLNPAQALDEIGCTAEQLEHGEVDFLDVQIRLLEYGQRKSGPLFALRAGSFVKVEHLGVFGLLLKSGLAIENAVDQASRILPALPKPFANLKLVPAEGRLKIEVLWGDDRHDPTSLALVTEYIFSFIHNGGPLVAGWPIPLERVEFSHSPLASISAYEEHFQCKVSFNSDRNTFATLVDSGKPFGFTSVALFTELESMFARLTTQETPENDKVAEIRRLITSEMTTRRPTERLIAERLSVSESTLRRWLAACGTTFQKELDAALSEMAIKMLDDEGCEIKSVAARLRYSDPAAFHRAFKRWTGVTPAQYKNKKSSQPKNQGRVQKKMD